MAKNNCYFKHSMHKNIIRDKFIRSISPAVAAKMRAILDELKRGGVQHG